MKQIARRLWRRRWNVSWLSMDQMLLYPTAVRISNHTQYLESLQSGNETDITYAIIIQSLREFHVIHILKKQKLAAGLLVYIQWCSWPFKSLAKFPVLKFRINYYDCRTILITVKVTTKWKQKKNTWGICPSVAFLHLNSTKASKDLRIKRHSCTINNTALMFSALVYSILNEEKCITNAEECLFHLQ